MDCKITKKRFYDFLSYEWIKIIAFVVVAILAFAYFFELTSVSLAPGQNFKYFIDENVVFGGTGKSRNFETFLSNGVFSSNVEEISCELLQKDNNVLSPRLQVGEGTVIFTEKNRAEKIIDDNDVYTLDKLQTDCENYLSGFLKTEFDGKSREEKRVLSHDFNNLSEEKIERNMLKRIEDYRFFKNKYRKGDFCLEDEKVRIKKLCEDLTEYSKLFEKDGSGNYIHEEIFYRYTKYLLLTQNEYYGSDYTEIYNLEIEEGRENAVYGINLGKLSNGNSECSEFFRVKETDSANGVILEIFDFNQTRVDLNYESISFVVAFVKQFSDILG